MTTLKPFLTACPPRPISQASDHYAANLIRGIERELSSPEGAKDFLQTTHLTSATEGLLRMVMDKMTNGESSTSPSVYQLYSRYSGGKTHGMLVTAAAAIHPELSYWQESAGIIATNAKVIAFNGEDSSPQSGMELGQQGDTAKSLAGYLLFHLGGRRLSVNFRKATSA